MAKDQNLSLNPSKISGLCGRLMCCLKYECEAYREFKETFGEGVPELLPEEFYEDVESEDDYYTELLQVDGVAEVDYQLMVEAAEIERVVAEEPEEPAKRKKSRSKKRRSSKGSKKKERKAKDKEPKAEEAAAEAKPAAQAKKAPGSKKKRRPRRKKPKAQQEAKAE